MFNTGVTLKILATNEVKKSSFELWIFVEINNFWQKQRQRDKETHSKQLITSIRGKSN